MTRRLPLPETVLAVLLLAAPARSQQLGGRCEPGDPAPAGSSMTCQVTDEWDFFPGLVSNARKGDILTTFATCDFPITRLLRGLPNPQFFTHAGMMTQNRYQIRHSTAAAARIKEGCGGPCTDGVPEDRLRLIWPGSITQSITDAFEGSVFVEPDGVTGRAIGPFRADPIQCPAGAHPVFPLVLKPDIEDEESSRAQLEAAADRLMGIDAHYRFFAYTRGDISGDNGFTPLQGWAHDRVATMCSSFIWTALRQAEVTLEGLTSEDGERERDPAADGLYLYTEQERLTASEVLYDALYDEAYESGPDVGVWLTDAADDVANQVLNCFARDDCDEAAKDSEAWREPGVGSTVSPDDMLNWDPYSNGEEHPIYQPGRYALVHTWQRSSGTGSLEGTALFAEVPVPDAAVSIPSLGLATTTNEQGRFRFAQVREGNYTVAASRQMLSAEASVRIEAGQRQTVDLNLAVHQDSVPSTRFHRLVRVRGTMRIVDDEDVFANERCHFNIDEELPLDPVNHPRDAFTFQKCCGDEVVGYIRVRVRLELAEEGNSTTGGVKVHVDATAKLHESTDCDADEPEDEERRSVSVDEDAQVPIVIRLSNGADLVDMDLTVSNDPRPRS